MKKAICRRDYLSFKKGQAYDVVNDNEVVNYSAGMVVKFENINRYFRIKGAIKKWEQNYHMK